MWNVPYAEHWTNWISRKSNRTHFLRPGTSSPQNNSAGLYDGSAEARQIILDAIAHVELGNTQMILIHALDYLKGRDLSPERFSYTADFFGPTAEEFLANLVARGEAEDKPELVQIAPLTFPDKPCAPVDVAIFDDSDMHAEEYPSWNLNVPKTPGC